MTAALWVVDTNVVVAAVLTGEPASPPAQILTRMLSGELRFTLCVELLSEYRKVLLRPRIQVRHALSEAEVDALLEALATNAVILDIAGRNEIAPDPGDNHLWRLIAARTGMGLITGDALLIRKPPAGCHAHTPKDWLEQNTT